MAIPQSPADEGLPSALPNLLEALGFRCLEPALMLIVSHPGCQLSKHAYEVGRTRVCPLLSFPSAGFYETQELLEGWWASPWEKQAPSPGAGSVKAGKALPAKPGAGGQLKPHLL